MPEKVVINPVTRISGFLEITAYIEKNKIVDAKSSGVLFRGFEKMLRGRPPLDAVYFTERICGICSTAHSIVSTRALENVYGIRVNANEAKLQGIIHGGEFLQNHLRHFYQYVLPDYVSGFDGSPMYTINHRDFRIPEEKGKILREDYYTSIEYSRLAHKLIAVLGGKAPHNHGIVPGGVTAQITGQKIEELKSYVNEIRGFIANKMIQDVYTIADYYKDYFLNGIGYGNLMSYGLYENYNLGKTYVNPEVIINGEKRSLDPSKISENIYSSWYKGNTQNLEPLDDNWEAQYPKEDGYSWVKAPRYEGYAMEVGPLARLYINGEYREGISTMNRLIARALEAKRIAEIMIELLNELENIPLTEKKYNLASNAKGRGLSDTTRGALGHWINVEDGVIKNYTIITPSTWNLSSKDLNGVYGTLEKALIGTYVEDNKAPVEIGRIVRSFDPCVSCATHVLSNNLSILNVRVV
ncbi:Ni/Fe hydrogenase [Clostridium bovifaecis]|uniref:Ni/Fe hydrogenase n=1 Tax=Clostridium bovifaecis TaxID=2184719 RepID=A0A6I6ESJ7_9CLOT|nr:Ni/Fe hydrogenase [Clostridium bovifaecis]